MTSERTNEGKKALSIWEWDQTGLRDKSKSSFERLLSFLIEMASRKKSIFSRLLYVDPESKPTKREPDWGQITNPMREKFSDTKEYTEIHNVLTFVIRKGVDEQVWGFQTDPGYLSIYKQPTPHCTPITMPLVNQLHEWKRTFLQTPVTTNPKQLIGDVIFNAIAYSCICSAQALVAMIVSIRSGHIYANDSVAWIPTHLNWRGKANQEFRRVIIDPMIMPSVQALSDGLKGKFADDSNIELDRLIKAKRINEVLFSYINRSFMAREIKLDERPQKLRALLDAQLAYMDLRIPSMFSHYASRKEVINHSLTEACWRQLQGVEQETEEQEASVIMNPLNMDNYDTEDQEIIRGETLSSLYKLYRKLPSKAALKERLNLWIESRTKSLNPKNKKSFPVKSVLLLAQWQKFLIDRKEGQGANAGTETLRQKLYGIAPPLVEYIADQDCEQFTPAEWIEIFRSIIDAIENPATRQHTTFFLFSFQEFLVKEGYTCEFGEGGLSSFKTELLPVDAEIICEDAYQQIRQSLSHSYANTVPAEVLTIMKIMLALGGRAAMRRQEALYLRYEDFFGNKEIVVSVRVNDIRTLKTGNARRKIPLYLLMEPDELEELSNWLHKRGKEIKEDSLDEGYLFAVPRLGKQRFREDEIVRPIRDVMRAVMGRNNSQFHQLRHSATTWIITRLILADHKLSLPYFDHLPKTKAYLERSEDFLHGCYEEYGPSRRHLYYVANLIGHSGPDISLEHYIHSIDWLIAALVKEYEFSDSTTQIQASLASSSTGYHRRAQEAQYLGRSLAKTYSTIKRLKKVSIHFLSESVVELPPPPLNPDIFEIWDAMNMKLNLKSHIETIFQQTGVTDQQISQYLATAAKIANEEPISERFRKHEYPPRSGLYTDIPRKPAKNLEKPYMEMANQKISSLSNEHRECFLQIYLSKVHKNREWLDFSHSFEVKEFLELLLLMDVEEQDLKFEHYTTDKAKESKQKAYWSNSLKPYYKANIETKIETKPESRNLDGWLRIRWLNSKTKEASPGLRFVVMMHEIAKVN